jgi:hypothetical protein
MNVPARRPREDAAVVDRIAQRPSMRAGLAPGAALDVHRLRISPRSASAGVEATATAHGIEPSTPDDHD